jgi:hypothetical protein
MNVKCPEKKCFFVLKDKENLRSLLSLATLRFAIARFICNSRKNHVHSLEVNYTFLTSHADRLLTLVALARSTPPRTKLSRSAESARGECFRRPSRLPVSPQTRQLFCRHGFLGRWDNGRHKLKFRPIHAKTGELRTELSDLRSACRVARDEDANFMANLSAAIGCSSLRPEISISQLNPLVPGTCCKHRVGGSAKFSCWFLYDFPAKS